MSNEGHSLPGPRLKMHMPDLIDEIVKIQRELRNVQRYKALPYYTRHATFTQSIPTAANTSVGPLSSVNEYPDVSGNVYGVTPWSSGTFTTPVDGVYSSGFFTPGAAGAARTTGVIQINGTTQAGNDTPSGGSGRLTVNMDHYDLTAGDVVTWLCFQNSGGPITMSGWITLTHHF